MSIITLLLAAILIYGGALLSAYFRWSYKTLIRPIDWFLGLFKEVKEEEPETRSAKQPTHKNNE